MKNTLLILTLLLLICSGCKQQFNGKGLKEGRVAGKLIAIDSSRSPNTTIVSIQSTDIREGIVDTVYSVVEGDESQNIRSLLQKVAAENIRCELTFDRSYARTKFSAPEQHTNWITLSSAHVCYDIKAKFTTQ